MSKGSSQGAEHLVASLPRPEAPSQAGLSWPRPLYQRRWFAWRPVRLNGEGGGWAWLRTITKTRLLYRAGDYLFEGNVYALLP